MTALVDRHCVHRPAEEGPLASVQVEAYLQEVPEWQVEPVDGLDTLVRSFSFKDFNAALGFAAQVGALADEEDHHPEITIEWGRAQVRWWTHTVKGLSENDFIMAAKTDQIPGR